MTEQKAPSLTAYYIVALTCIAVLALASHFVLDKGLELNRQSSGLVNIMGRQRMLSQRIVALASVRREGDSGADTDLSDAIEEMAAMHAKITGLVASNEDSPYIADGSLDREVREFIVHARRVAKSAPHDPAAASDWDELLRQSRRPLLETLDDAVRTEQRASEMRIRTVEQTQLIISLLVLVTLLVEAFAIFRPLDRRLVEYQRQLLALATLDPMTGALNRRGFFERAALECSGARRHGRPLTVMMLDLDHFKRINDAHGHAAGDKVLIAVVDAVLKTVRPTDVFGRMGGEEFALLLLETGLQPGAEVAERIRNGIAALTIPSRAGEIRVTVSIGVSAVTSDSDIHYALASADEALYKAKQAGRDRTVIASEATAR